MPQDRQTEIFPFYGRAGARLGRPSGQTPASCGVFREFEMTARNQNKFLSIGQV